MDRNELISALADGQLRGRDAVQAVEAVCADRSALATWQAYHLIGDVLRSPDLAAGAPAPAFLDRLSARLAQEHPQVVPASVAGQLPPERVSAPAANDSSFRWKLVAGFASVAAVAAVGWSVMQASIVPAAQPQLAAVPAPVNPVAAPAAASSQPQATVLTRAPAGVMIRDPKLDELLQAHRQHGGASALQMPAFLRNATFEGPGGR
ncbi:MAG TPA: sigma-E factor negative regulatory protein [Ramlibacter sp.]|nr:sigma-E factor negative regulatory protein [Ramlibacter sp.]